MCRSIKDLPTYSSKLSWALLQIFVQQVIRRPSRWYWHSPQMQSGSPNTVRHHQQAMGRYCWWPSATRMCKCRLSSWQESEALLYNGLPSHTCHHWPDMRYRHQTARWSGDSVQRQPNLVLKLEPAAKKRQQAQINNQVPMAMLANLKACQQ